LPEVETIKNEITPHVLGKEIKGIELFWERMVKEPAAEEFRARVTGQTITKVTRLGKYLFFHLSSGERLIMHMKMTGSLLVNPSDRQYTRAIIHLDNGTEIHFRDPRKFGVMWLSSDESDVRKKLGPEPLDVNFTREILEKILDKRTAPIKPVLLDQKLMAGIGNMYADESLFEAKLHPERPAGSLSREETGRLHRAIRKVLRKALASGGASVRNYIRPDGNPGTAHDEFSVAHGVGKNCPRCGTPIKRIVVRGRGTYFCPHCQPEP